MPIFNNPATHLFNAYPKLRYAHAQRKMAQDGKWKNCSASNRSLRCARTTLHMNLFASFAINNALWLFWYRLVVNEPNTITNNG
ncbi:unnamed protein product, partial [Timema podura]|nr:unnamed protein product [Timema podura]